VVPVGCDDDDDDDGNGIGSGNDEVADGLVASMKPFSPLEVLRSCAGGAVVAGTAFMNSVRDIFRCDDGRDEGCAGGLAGSVLRARDDDDDGGVDALSGDGAPDLSYCELVATLAVVVVADATEVAVEVVPSVCVPAPSPELVPWTPWHAGVAAINAFREFRLPLFGGDVTLLAGVASINVLSEFRFPVIAVEVGPSVAALAGASTGDFNGDDDDDDDDGNGIGSGNDEFADGLVASMKPFSPLEVLRSCAGGAVVAGTAFMNSVREFLFTGEGEDAVGSGVEIGVGIGSGIGSGFALAAGISAAGTAGDAAGIESVRGPVDTVDTVGSAARGGDAVAGAGAGAGAGAAVFAPFAAIDRAFTSASSCLCSIIRS
jgi:hypothetical protein